MGTRTRTVVGRWLLFSVGLALLSACKTTHKPLIAAGYPSLERYSANCPDDADAARSFLTGVGRTVAQYAQANLNTATPEETPQEPIPPLELDLVYDSQGRLQDVEIRSKTGIEAFDTAVIEGLWIAPDIGPPPPCLLDDEGRFRIEGLTCKINVVQIQR